MLRLARRGEAKTEVDVKRAVRRSREGIVFVVGLVEAERGVFETSGGADRWV